MPWRKIVLTRSQIALGALDGAQNAVTSKWMDYFADLKMAVFESKYDRGTIFLFVTRICAHIANPTSLPEKYFCFGFARTESLISLVAVPPAPTFMRSIP
jgi:hypothetical protein